MRASCRRPIGFALTLLCGATSCVLRAPGYPDPATELATFPVNGSGDHSVVVSLDGSREVKFSANVAMTFDDLRSAQYLVDLLQDGVLVAHTSCDPIDVRMCMLHVSLPSSYSGYCRMQCKVRVPKGGPTLVRATFTAVGENVTIDRAKLIVEQ